MDVGWGPVMWLSRFFVLDRGLGRWGSSEFVGVGGGSEFSPYILAG